jgi:tetratricopeptide (TPR) repeat protein
MLGDYAEAVTYCQQSLELQRELGDRFGQAETWDSLGYASLRLGRHEAAISCYRTAVALYQAFDDRYNEADSTASLGDAHYAAGDVDSACTAWRHACDIIDLLRHPDADKIRAKLANTRRSGGGPDAGHRAHEGEQPDPEARIGQRIRQP